MNRTTLVPDVVSPREPIRKVTGNWDVGNGFSFRTETSLQRISDSRFVYMAQFHAAKQVPTGLMFFAFNVPIGKQFCPMIDGKEVKMPEVFQKLTVVEQRIAQEIRFQAGDALICIKGPFSVRIQDNRRYKREEFHIRLVPLTGASGNLSDFQFSCEFRKEALQSLPIDISMATNMSFSDQTAGDGKGGWTDQGPEEDFSCMKPGKQEVGGILFNILDPSENRGTSCVVVSRERRYPSCGAVEVNAEKAHKYLYLLNTAAWLPRDMEPVGSVVLSYADGSVETKDFVKGVDTGNWWRPTISYPNGLLVWTGQNAGGTVGAFASAIPLKNVPLKRLAFQPGKGVWMVIAASFTNFRLERAVEKPLILKEGKDWSKFNPVRNVVPDSPLDFSKTQHKPAGKFGWVTKTKEGHFSFEKRPELRIRFLGTNLCQTALFPEKKEAEWIASQLAATGYNTIRLHQFESGLRRYGAKNTLDFNLKNLDKFDYLIAQCVKQGLYICADVYVGRPILPGDGILECPEGNNKARKVLNYISPTALQNWKEYAKRLLTHRNPYTGRTLIEEPGFYSVNLDNEAPFHKMWDQVPGLSELVKTSYNADRKKRGLDADSGLKDKKDFLNYLYTRQEITQREQMRYLKEELGAKFLITNLNNLSEDPGLQKSRSMLDFTDAHIYHDHPSYPQCRWSLPAAYHQKSSTELLASSFQSHSAMRFRNVPHTITELDLCNPNRYRAEGPALTGAIASMQDWDGLYRFAYTHNIQSIRNVNVVKGFDSIYDPIALLGDRIVWHLFVRGDMKTAPVAGIFPISRKNPPARYPKDFLKLCLYGQIGNRLTEEENPELELAPEVRRAMERLALEKKVTSMTGEFELDGEALRIRIVTPKSEVFTLKNGTVSGRFMKLRNVTAFSTVSAHSRDGLDLRESREILLFHLTNVSNTGCRFLTERRQILEENGTLPLLMAAAEAEVELAVCPDFSGTVDAFSPSGEKLGIRPYAKTAEGIRFKIGIGGKNGVTPVYLVRK